MTEKTIIEPNSQAMEWVVIVGLIASDNPDDHEEARRIFETTIRLQRKEAVRLYDKEIDVIIDSVINTKYPQGIILNNELKKRKEELKKREGIK